MCSVYITGISLPPPLLLVPEFSVFSVGHDLRPILSLVYFFPSCPHFETDKNLTYIQLPLESTFIMWTDLRFRGKTSSNVWIYSADNYLETHTHISQIPKHQLNLPFFFKQIKKRLFTQIRENQQAVVYRKYTPDPRLQILDFCLRPP